MPLTKKLLLLSLTLLPLAGLIYLATKYTVNMPITDQWDFSYIIVSHNITDTLNFDVFMRRHVDHRFPFPALIILMLSQYTDWNIGVEVSFNIFLGMLIFLSVAFCLVRLARSGPQNMLLLLPALAIIIFSITQWENWFWGMQISLFLSVLFAVLTIITLSRERLSWSYLLLAALFASIACFSFGNGLIVWALGFVALLFHAMNPQNNRRMPLLAKGFIWLVLAGIATYTYMKGYTSPPLHPPLSYALEHPFRYMRYVLAFLGSPLHKVDGSAITSLIFGIVGLIIFILCTALSWRMRKTSQCFLLLPFILLGLYAIGTAMLIGLGRSGFGLYQALNSRYSTFANFLWIADSVLSCYIFCYRYNHTGWLRKGTLIFILAITILAAISSYKNITVARLSYEQRLMAYNHILEHSASGRKIPLDNEILRLLYPPAPERIIPKIYFLEKHKLCLFAE